MNSADNPLVVELSTKRDSDAIIAFLHANSAMTPNVFDRTEALMREQAAAGRVLLIKERKNPAIVAMSSIYVLGQKKIGGKAPEINCIIHDEKKVEPGVTAEFGSMIRDQKRTDLPSGFGRILLIGLSAFMALRFDTRFDLFVAEVFHTAAATKEFLQHGGVVRAPDGRPKEFSEGSHRRYNKASPFHCDPITRVHPDLLRAFGDTSNDPKALQSQRDVFRMAVQNVVPVAEMFQRIQETGYIEDFRPPMDIGYKPGKAIYVDLNQIRFGGTPIADLTRAILVNREYFENYPLSGTWREAARHLGLRIGEPANFTSGATITSTSAAARATIGPCPPRVMPANQESGNNSSGTKAAAIPH